MIFLTLAIPTFKSNQTLINLLNSIKNQHYDFSSNEVEIQISDNDPESGLRGILDNTFDSSFLKHVIYSRNNSNLGYDGNLELLVKYANGEYIKFVADDDQLKKGFIQNHIHLIRENLPDIAISNFDLAIVQSVNSFDIEDQRKKLPIMIVPLWNYEKLSNVEGKYGQISTLTFRKSLIQTLKQNLETNFIHVFWFFSLLENSKVVYDPNPEVICYPGSPNFSGSLYQIIDIPFQGVNSIRQARITSKKLKTRILRNEKRYAIKGLRLFPDLTWSDRAKLLWKNKSHFSSLATLQYAPYVFLPKPFKSIVKSKKNLGLWVS